MIQVSIGFNFNIIRKSRIARRFGVNKKTIKQSTHLVCAIFVANLNNNVKQNDVSKIGGENESDYLYTKILLLSHACHNIQFISWKLVKT